MNLNKVVKNLNPVLSGFLFRAFQKSLVACRNGRKESTCRWTLDSSFDWSGMRISPGLTVGNRIVKFPLHSIRSIRSIRKQGSDRGYPSLAATPCIGKLAYLNTSLGSGHSHLFPWPSGSSRAYFASSCTKPSPSSIPGGPLIFVWEGHLSIIQVLRRIRNHCHHLNSKLIIKRKW